jgi:hypothetical protein
MSTPTPNVRQLLRQYDHGQITPAEFRQQMAAVAKEVLEEIEADHLNPMAAMAENLQCRYEVARLMVHHSAQDVRDILEALAQEEHCASARFLWNASHPHIPLHTFFRIRRQPTLRIHRIRGCGASALRQLNRTQTAQGPDSAGATQQSPTEPNGSFGGAQSMEVEFEFNGHRQWIRLQRDRRGRLNLISPLRA